MAEAVKKRSEIPAGDRWAVEDLFENDAAWEQALEEASGEVEKAAGYKGRLGESAALLREYLDFEDALDRQVNLVYMPI